MTDERRKHWRPYLEYLERLGSQREAEGQTAADIYSEYWTCSYCGHRNTHSLLLSVRQVSAWLI